MENNVNINAKLVQFPDTGLVKQIIVANYRDRCNMCFQYVNVGDKIAWYGKGFGVRHFECYMKNPDLLTNEQFDKLTDW